MLLYLVRRNELDVLDIPIAVVAAQYLEILAAIQQIDVDAVGDFLEMATRLMEIKSRMMLPRHFCISSSGGRRSMRPGASHWRKTTLHGMQGTACI